MGIASLNVQNEVNGVCMYLQTQCVTCEFSFKIGTRTEFSFIDLDAHGLMLCLLMCSFILVEADEDLSYLLWSKGGHCLMPSQIKNKALMQHPLGFKLCCFI